MARIKKRKLNQSILQIPNNVIITSKWLAENGISAKLAWWYVYSHWLEKVGENAFKKPNEVITWPGVIFTLQDQLKLPIHLSGKSSLLILGKAHFIPLAECEIFLNIEDKCSVPKWVYKENLISEKLVINNKLLINYESQDTIIKEIHGFKIYVSCPELAIIEILANIPKQQDFQEACLLMEGLKYLRAPLIQSILERCISIKVKRLFLYLATKYMHLWLKDLDTTKINLGRGKIVIAGGGVYNAIYQISVPKIDMDT